MTIEVQWTKEYCGITHLISPEQSITKKLWFSVERIGKKAMLVEWFPGCQFSPRQEIYNSFEDAKIAAECMMVKNETSQANHNRL